MDIFRSIFGGKSENSSSAYKAEEEAEPYWLQAAKQKEFMEACLIQLGSGPELQALQQDHYDKLVEKSKQARETPGTYTPRQRDDSTFEGLPRVTMADLDAREEYISSHDIHHSE